MRVATAARTLGGLCLATSIAASAGPAAPADPQQAAADKSTTESGVARPIRIITLGDSITRGVRTGVTAEQTFAARLESQLGAAGTHVRVVNMGIGGERTDQALLRLDQLWGHRPDIVTIMYGTNDSYVDIGATESRLPVARYRENLIRMVTLLLERGIRPVLMTAPRWADDAAPNGRGENPNSALEPYVAACREVAGLWRLPLVDHYAHWTAARDEGMNLRDWTTDGCHPNPAGHDVLAQTMMKGLHESLGPSLRVRQALHLDHD